MREIIKARIEERLEEEISPQNKVKFLKSFSVDEYFDILVSVLYLYTRPKKGTQKKSIFLTEVISAIGHSVRNKLKQKRDSAIAARTGAFLLYTFEELGALQVTLGQGSNGHATYIIQVLDDEFICNLWEALEPSQIEKLPSETPYEPWKSAKHSTGASLVKTGNKEVLDSLNPEDHPIVFNCVNKAQAQGWKINESIYNLHLWALRNKAEAFSDIWDQQSAEARATKLREATAIGNIAKKFIDKTFYHLYYYDFRGRKYPTTAYLHEQGSDLARGLLLRADSKPIGEEGFFWLMVSIASNWAGDAGRDDGAKTDKIPLRDRYLWSLDNEEIILSYADNPKVSQNWMKADKPWQFLASCIELRNFRNWQKDNGNSFGYESHLECYIDGSNNGSQHLSALTRDEITAPHVNLVPLELPGDLYKYVADHVWARLQLSVNLMNAEDIEACEAYIDTVIDYKKQISEAQPKSELRQKLVEEFKEFKEENRFLSEIAAPVFWLRITDTKHKRKIVKR